MRRPPVPTPLVQRLGSAPIVRSGSLPGYGALFNAGLLHHDGRFHLFARAVRDGYRPNPGSGPRFLDYISDLVVFVSDDGHSYEFGYVLASAGANGVHCYEDPRVQWVTSNGDRHLVMTYTNLPPSDTGLPWRIGAHHLDFDDGRFVLDDASGTLLGPDGVENKDAVIFNLADGRVAMIHRVHPNMQVAVFDDLDHLWAADARYWDAHLADIDDHTIITPSAGALGVGAGAPPVETPHGLLLLFHERNRHGVYTMNAALLDPATGRVDAVLDEPILVPDLDWERNGDVDDVVFVQGVHRLDDGALYAVYGAADSHVGAATISTGRLVEQLLNGGGHGRTPVVGASLV
ncbi:MAG: hypothetical protein OEU32_03625 [Acidimicrobiia bacterium]|nr:hypothetical protein [Acidimicrobiia bacterium]